MEDRFEIKRLIGKGRTGGVYEAVCRETQKSYTIRRFFSLDGEYRTGWEPEFLNNMKRLSKISHPNIAKVIESATDEDGVYLVTDYYPTTPLNEAYDEGMDLDTFMTFAEHGLGAIAALHQEGLTHGYIAYDSFILSHVSDDAGIFILKDYGLRRIAPIIQGEPSSYTLPNDPLFIAPEIFAHGIANKQTDLYMFGQLCYVMLAGCHPISGKTLVEAAFMHRKHEYETVAEINAAVPMLISNWVERMTNPDPLVRPSSALKALNELQNIPHLFNSPHQNSEEVITHNFFNYKPSS